MDKNIDYSVQMWVGDVKLNISVNENLKREEKEVLKNWGYIEVSTGYLKDENCFWDNISYFIDISRKKFKKECGEELKEKGFKVGETRRAIKTLLKRAFELNLLTRD